MLEDLLLKKSRERFNRGVQTKRIKSKNREMQTTNDVQVQIDSARHSRSGSPDHQDANLQPGTVNFG
jgi:hypothetical protein